MIIDGSYCIRFWVVMKGCCDYGLISTAGICTKSTGRAEHTPSPSVKLSNSPSPSSSPPAASHIIPPCISPICMLPTA